VPAAAALASPRAPARAAAWAAAVAAGLFASSSLPLASAAGQLLGVSGIQNSPQLLRIDAASGAVAPVGAGAGAPFEEVAMGLGAVDAASGTYFVVGLNASTSASTVVGLSVATGAVTAACASPFAWTGAGESVAFAGAPRGQLLVGGHDPATGARVLGSLDPASCAFARLATLPAGLVSWPADASTYSPATDELVALFAADANATRAQVVSVSLATGRARAWPAEPGSVCAGAETLSYDAATGLVFAVGAPAGGGGGGGTRRLLALDPRALSCSVVGDVGPAPGYNDLLAGLAGLDAAARALYWVSQAGGADDDAPFYLVATPLDASRGGPANSTAVPLEDCTGAFAFSCPWQLAFLADPGAAAAR